MPKFAVLLLILLKLAIVAAVEPGADVGWGRALGSVMGVQPVLGLPRRSGSRRSNISLLLGTGRGREGGCAACAGDDEVMGAPKDRDASPPSGAGSSLDKMRCVSLMI